MTGSGNGSILEGGLNFHKIKIKNVVKASDKGIFAIAKSNYDDSFVCIDKLGIAGYWRL